MSDDVVDGTATGTSTLVKTISATPLEFDGVRDTAYSHRDPRFDHVLHLFHAGWHGIRSACACLPGHKLAIPHEGTLDGECIRHIYGLIFKHRIKAICVQGVSENAINLATLIRAEFGRDLTMVAVTHVNSAQFEYAFEIEMQRILLDGLRRGTFDRIASVKPDFHHVIDAYWPETIYNCAPNITAFAAAVEPDLRAVFVPLEHTWRKNLYTNILAACHCAAVDTVYAVNRPGRLADIADLSKLQITGYLRTMNLYSFMGTVGCVMNASLAECQPMVQLEALGMGTPCLTGPLRLHALESHALTVLTEVAILDSPLEMQQKLETVLRERSRDARGFHAMTLDYLRLRFDACIESYGHLLER